MSAQDGRRLSAMATSSRVTSRRSRICSSRRRLLASTISAGSIKTVLPDADSSWTMPAIRRLLAGATGTTRRPSRTAGVTSGSTHPSCTARAITRRIAPAMTPFIEASERRMSANSGDALSRTLPQRSSRRSMERAASG